MSPVWARKLLTWMVAASPRGGAFENNRLSASMIREAQDVMPPAIVVEGVLKGLITLELIERHEDAIETMDGLVDGYSVTRLGRAVIAWWDR